MITIEVFKQKKIRIECDFVINSIFLESLDKIRQKKIHNFNDSENVFIIF